MGTVSSIWRTSRSCYLIGPGKGYQPYFASSLEENKSKLSFSFLARRNKPRYTMCMRRIVALTIGLLFLPLSAHAALLYIDPAEGEYGPGDTFIASVRLTPEECVNVVHVEVAYPSDTLRAVDFSKGSSILTLWVEEPRIDEKGVVRFSGGIPGGYCGRIAGDPVVSNILGKIVFSVIGSTTPEAVVHISGASKAYLSDGEGTEVPVTTADARFQILGSATGKENPWLAATDSDLVPPEAFEAEVQSTRGVFDGDYYVVFSTVDKQSGIDHFEIYEGGVWKVAASPYRLRDQSLNDEIMVKAIDKAGNERLASYDPSKAPERQSPPYGYGFLTLAIVIFVIGVGVELYRIRRRASSLPPLPPTPPTV